MSTSDLITQRQAAAILNRSVSAVSRAIKDGRLEYADAHRRLLHRPGLEQRFARNTRARIDAPQSKAQLRPRSSRAESSPIAMNYWQRLSDKLSFVLDGAPAYWAKVPDAQRLMLFCQTLDELRSQCKAEGWSPRSSPQSSNHLPPSTDPLKQQDQRRQRLGAPLREPSRETWHHT